MQKTPLGFQGPSNQLSRLFSEIQIYKACQLILAGAIDDWQKPGNTGISRAVISAAVGATKTHQVKLHWPLSRTDHHELPGNCDCDEPKPCVHIAALALLNRSRLSRLQPFTHQVKALQNVNQTFTAWMQKQDYDPFPAMARHRVVYLLDESKDPAGFTVTLHKAYLSQDERYTIKEPLDNSLLWKKKRPKFVSLADQRVFYLMQQAGLSEAQKVTIKAERDSELLMAVVATGRCFWRASYRQPISFQTSPDKPLKNALKLTEDLSFVLAENALVKHVAVKKAIKIPDALRIKPRIIIHSEQLTFPWPPQSLVEFDWAALRYFVGDDDFSFSLADVRRGRVAISEGQLTRLAEFAYILDKFDSVCAHFEAPVSERFEINDRYLYDDFTLVAPYLIALNDLGWDVVIAKSFRLNRIKADRWYVQVEKQTKTGSASAFGLEVGVQLEGETINLMPYIVKAIKTGQFEQVQKDLVLQLDSGQMIGVDVAKVKQIIATLGELYDDKPLDKDERLPLAEQQLMQVVQLQQNWQQEPPQLTSSKSKKKTESIEPDNGLQWLGDTSIQEKIKKLQTYKKLPKTNVPKNLQATLRPYQQQGLDWLIFLQQHNLHGLLADDMGLGKTLQTLALLLHHQQTAPNNSQKTSLIVAPTSLLGNWQAEAARFTPSLKTLILSGANREQDYQAWDDYDLIITSYGVMNRDITELAKRGVFYLILDEAQAIKNRKTQTAQAAKAVPARHRLCLTGTPVENHLGELWSMFDFLMPGFLGTEKRFEHVYRFPIEKDDNQERLQQLQQRMAPFILRRTKSEVAKELPDKTEILKMIDLEERQAHVYESIRLTLVDEIKQAFKDQKGNQILIGNALLRLRQVCCHPSLVNLQSVDKNAGSAKLDWLTTAVPNLVEEGRRILIFSSFTGMLSLIEKELKQLEIPYLSLTGKTPAKQRTRDIARFQDEQVPVYLISLKAGGAGINLTAADTVIHYDPWWNPAAEQQASDRAHRIGQDKQVFVYKLISRGTVEEKIHTMQQQKQALANQLLASDTAQQNLSQHQWQDLLKPISS